MTARTTARSTYTARWIDAEGNVLRDGAERANKKTALRDLALKAPKGYAVMQVVTGAGKVVYSRTIGATEHVPAATMGQEPTPGYAEPKGPRRMEGATSTTAADVAEALNPATRSTIDRPEEAPAAVEAEEPTPAEEPDGVEVQDRKGRAVYTSVKGERVHLAYLHKTVEVRTGKFVGGEWLTDQGVTIRYAGGAWYAVAGKRTHTLEGVKSLAGAVEALGTIAR